MEMKKVVFVPSIQHTGTWFTLEFLKRFYPNSSELTFVREGYIKPNADMNYEHKYLTPLPNPLVTHIHFPIVRYLNFDVNFPGTPFEKKWYANLGTMRSLPIPTILLFANFFKTVIPVRDPLAAILTREARHPQFRHFYIIDGFVSLAKDFAKHPNVKFLPIDMHKDADNRKQLLREVLGHCEIPVNENIVKEVGEAWIPQNPTPGNRFKEAYGNGDLKEIQKMLGPKWAEVEYMKNMMGIILPFLGGLGYTRDQFIW